MKKSEYITARREYWTSRLEISRQYHTPELKERNRIRIEEFVSRDVAAAEAAFDDEFGWEPENYSLPVVLSITHNDAYIISLNEDGTTGDFLAIISPEGKWDDLFAAPEDVKRLMHAVLDWWNSRPEIQRALEIARGHKGNYLHALEFLDNQISKILDHVEGSNP